MDRELGAESSPGNAVARVIVRLEPGADAGAEARKAALDGASVSHVFSAVIRGFSAAVPERALPGLARNPRVASIEPDVVMTGASTQSPAPWGLDRLDQRQLPLSASYFYQGDGSGVTAYVLDTGVSSGHVDFGGRVRSGYSAFADGRASEDCNGHGTHVAGTLAGTTYGVAKAVTPVAVRVLGCDGSGRASDVIAGIDWVVRDHEAGRPAVANLSLGGGASAAVDAAVQGLIDDGIVVTAAAGNATVDACSVSPARLPTAVTVGATGRDDVRAPFSNYGACLDLFAPGVGIVSAGYSSPTASVTMAGTSMAAPHAAGVAAVLMSRNPSLTVEQVTALLLEAATSGVVGDEGTGSPDRLLHLPALPSTKPPSGSGYWMLRADGVVEEFGRSPFCGSAAVLQRSTTAVDVEPFPDGQGYWVLDASGRVEAFSCSSTQTSSFATTASVQSRLGVGERPVSMSALPDGSGYWVFTELGRVLPVGQARHYGDMAGVRLNGRVLDSVATPSGRGYFMVAADGGIFTFGDARFAGSMGGKRLNQPVMSMAPDPDGSGYWLVASDGGIFAFDARFYGSMGAVRLNRPVSGIVASPSGAGYLMVAEDGGVFTFGDVPFHGSLGASPPPARVESIAVMP